jgi:hypothetical protein
MSNTPRKQRDAAQAAIADLQRQALTPRRKGPLGAPSGTQAGARAIQEIVLANNEARFGLPAPEDGAE